MKMWFKGRTDLQKLFLAGAAGTLVAAVIVLGPPHGGGLTSWSAPSRAQVESAARYRQRDVTGVARDRDTFMRNCVTAEPSHACGHGRALHTNVRGAQELCIGPLEPDSRRHCHSRGHSCGDHRTPHVRGRYTAQFAGSPEKLGSRPRFPPRLRRAGDCNCRADNWLLSRPPPPRSRPQPRRPQPRRPQPAQHRPRARKAAQHGKGHKKGPGRED